MTYEFHKNSCPVFQEKYNGRIFAERPVCNCDNNISPNMQAIEDPAEANMCDGCQ